MAKQCVNEDETAYVNVYASRPVLTMRKKDASLRPLILTFADAIPKFGNGAQRGKPPVILQESWCTFGSQLENNFVVLKNRLAPVGRQGLTLF